MDDARPRSKSSRARIRKSGVLKYVKWVVGRQNRETNPGGLQGCLFTLFGLGSGQDVKAPAHAHSGVKVNPGVCTDDGLQCMIASRSRACRHGLSQKATCASSTISAERGSFSRRMGKSAGTGFSGIVGQGFSGLIPIALITCCHCGLVLQHETRLKTACISNSTRHLPDTTRDFDRGCLSRCFDFEQRVGQELSNIRRQIAR